MDKKKINVNMDVFYFKKYSKYVKQNGYMKSAINLFLTLKGCRTSCYINLNKRFFNSFVRILKYYKMYYETYDDENISFFIISNKPISKTVKYAFLLEGENYTEADHRVMGKFLEYPVYIDVRKVSSMKDIGSIQFTFMKNKKNRNDKKNEPIYGFRIPNNKINSKIIEKMNTIMKKYRKCIKKYLAEIYSEFTIEMNVKLNT